MASPATPLEEETTPSLQQARKQIQCDVEGCSESVEQEDFPSHMSHHLTEMAKDIQSLRLEARGSKERADNLAAELQKTKKAVQSHQMLHWFLLGAQFAILVGLVLTAFSITSVPEHHLGAGTVLPVDITTANFHTRIESGDKWSSKPFYTHPYGYKVRLEVQAGDTKSGDIVIGIRLMRGEFDNNLRWPFLGNFTVHVLLKDGPLVLNVTGYGKRVKEGDVDQYPLKYLRSISLNDLQTYESLHFQVSHYEQQDPSPVFQEVEPITGLPADGVAAQTRMMQEQVNEIRRKQEELSFPLTSGVIPVNVTMSKFHEWKKNGSKWFSESFYTHSYGYKVCLVVAEFTSQGSKYLAVFVRLVRGEFDNSLHWPFCGKFTIQLLDKDRKAHIDILEYPKKLGQRVLSGNAIAEKGFGLKKFISHKGLETYLQSDDSLLFRISHFEQEHDDIMEIHGFSALSQDLHRNQTLTWSMLTDMLYNRITMKNFSDYLKRDVDWYSLPFYSHVRGYKMFLEVKTNGIGGKTAVYLHLLRGEFDHDLEWPFTGTFRIDILGKDAKEWTNTHIVSFTEETGKRIRSYAQMGIGQDTSLYLTNSEIVSRYLVKDTITFRVSLVNSNHLPTSIPVAQEISKAQVELKRLWSILQDVLPVVFSVSDFTRYIESNIEWYSEPFYTHRHGYKMCLRLSPNGNGGTHIALNFYMLPGEFDDELSWPFLGILQLEVLSKSRKWVKQHLVPMYEDIRTGQRVTRGEMNNYGRGPPEYISHSELESEILISDTLIVRVSLFDPRKNVHAAQTSAEVPRKEKSTQSPRILPVNCSMTRFTHHRDSNSEWFCEPFYTHDRGYKMVLRVMPNGFEMLGTHVALTFHMMRGKFDEELSWPFLGTLRLAVLSKSGNWEKLHLVPMSEDIRTGERVATGETNPAGRGPPYYIAHNELEGARNNFLINDTLTFQVTLVNLEPVYYG